MPHQPFVTESIFFRSPKPEKIRIIGLYLKSVISRVANSVMGYTLRPVETTPEGSRAGVGFLGRGSENPPHQLGGKLPQRGQGRNPGKFRFRSMGPQKSRQNGQIMFSSHSYTSTSTRKLALMWKYWHFKSLENFSS